MIGHVVRRHLAGFLAVSAAGAGIGWGGGYGDAAQWLFAALAGAAGVAALLASRSYRPLARPAVAVLLAFAGLGALSAVWTIGLPVDALRWGAVTGGYAALVLAAGVSLRPEFVAVGIAFAAALTGTLGLIAAASFSTSFAERVDGGWRPQGPFAYGPALALLEVCALPVLLTGMARLRPAVAGLAAAGAAIAGGVLALDANRTAIGLATLVGALALASSARTVQVSRWVVAAALSTAALAGLGIHAVAGGWRGPHVHSSGWTVVATMACVAAAGLAWAAIRRLAARPGLPALEPGHERRLAVAAVALVAAASVGLGTAGALSARRFPDHQGFTHGRTWMWRVAADAAFDRPFGGSGAGTFLRATFLDQPGYGRITRFAHNLPLEAAAELGTPGFLLAIALYLAAVLALWRARGTTALWLLGPAVAAFLVSNAVDWTWHLAGIGAVFVLALGSLSARALR